MFCSSFPKSVFGNKIVRVCISITLHAYFTLPSPHSVHSTSCATIIRAQCSCNCFDTRRSFALKIVGSWTLICKGKQTLFRVLYRVTRMQSQL